MQRVTGRLAARHEGGANRPNTQHRDPIRARSRSSNVKWQWISWHSSYQLGAASGATQDASRRAPSRASRISSGKASHLAIRSMWRCERSLAWGSCGVGDWSRQSSPRSAGWISMPLPA